MRYERKAHAILQAEFGDAYLPSPWFRFREEDKQRERWCQPDALIVDFRSGVIAILEMKSKHCDRAWWQLFELYLPVVSRTFGGGWTYICCEIVRWFDPAVQCQQPPRLVRNITDLRPGDFGVHICWRHPRPMISL